MEYLVDGSDVTLTVRLREPGSSGEVHLGDRAGVGQAARCPAAHVGDVPFLRSGATEALRHAVTGIVGKLPPTGDLAERAWTEIVADIAR